MKKTRELKKEFYRDLEKAKEAAAKKNKKQKRAKQRCFNYNYYIAIYSYCNLQVSVSYLNVTRLDYSSLTIPIYNS